MKRVALAAATLVAAATPAAYGFHVSELSGMEGWMIAAATRVSGDFEGCDFDKEIRFLNGWRLTCATYSYAYAFQPDAVIFTKRVSLRGRTFIAVKVLIDDEMYEMRPVPVQVSR